MKKWIFSAAAFLMVAGVYSCARKTSSPTTSAPVRNAQAANVGRTLTEEKCTRCHRFYEPTDYSLAEWKPILQRMIPKARVDSAQAATITAYIERNAKPF